jgi:hypothetical protein
MKELPILFSGPMVRAILDGRKTMTRRIVKPQPYPECFIQKIKCETFEPTVIRRGEECPGEPVYGFYSDDQGFRCPYGQPGDRLYVRETWRHTTDDDGMSCVQWQADGLASPSLATDGGEGEFTGLAKRNVVAMDGGRWRPNIHMPRWASRLLLDVTSVRAERLQEITQQDAISEGFIKLPASGRGVLDTGGQYFGECWSSPRAGFLELWDKLNAKRGFPVESNPWVWVISFRRSE